MNGILIALLAALPAGAPADAGGGGVEDGLRPAFFRAAGARTPALVVQPQPEAALVAIRVTAATTGAPFAELALHWLTDQALREGALRLGAQVEGGHAGGRLVHAVVGPAAEFAALAELVRSALTGAAPPAGSLEAARVAAAAARAGVEEVADGLLRERLRAELEPTAAGGAGAGPLSGDALAGLRRRVYAPGALLVVVVGGVTSADALAALGSWPAAPRSEAPGRSAAVPADEAYEAEARGDRPVPAPEVNAPWAGVALPAPGLAPAVVAVVAEVLQMHMSAVELRQGRAEFWWLRSGPAVILLGAAEVPAAGAGRRAGGDPATALRALPAETATLLTPEAVTTAKRRLRRELLLAARTPQGLAAVLGEFTAWSGDAGAAAAFHAALGRVDTGAVEAALARLAETDAIVTELRP
jgi:predicted Zn-dependent peptidase